MGVSGHQSEIIELVLTYGFSGMDLNVVEFATRVRLKGVEYARRLFDSGKLKLGSFALPLEWDTDDETFAKDLKKLPEYAQAAVAAGCTRCIATVAPGSDKRPYHENFEFHKRRSRKSARRWSPPAFASASASRRPSIYGRNRHSSSCMIWKPSRSC